MFVCPQLEFTCRLTVHGDADSFATGIAKIDIAPACVLADAVVEKVAVVLVAEITALLLLVLVDIRAVPLCLGKDHCGIGGNTLAD